MSLICHIASASEHEVLFYTDPSHRFIKGYTPTCKFPTIRYNMIYIALDPK